MRRRRRPLRQGKFGNPGADHRVEFPRLAIRVVMAAIADAKPVKGLGHRTQAARHLGGAFQRGIHPRAQRLGLGAGLARPDRKIGRCLTGHLQALFKMVVEDHISHAEPLHRRQQACNTFDKPGFGAQLDAQVGHRARPIGLHRLHHRLCLVRPTGAALPAPALGEIGGGHAMGRRLAVGRRQGGHQRKGGRVPGKDLPFEAVAMQIDDPGQDVEPGQVHLGQRSPGQPPVRQRHRPALQLAVPKDRGAGQAQRRQGKGHRDSCGWAVDGVVCG